MRQITLIALLLLASCNSEPIFQPVPVDTPVAVTCKTTPVPVPAWPTDALRPGDGMFIKAKALIAEWKLRRGYEAQLEAANKACQ